MRACKNLAPENERQALRLIEDLLEAGQTPIYGPEMTGPFIAVTEGSTLEKNAKDFIKSVTLERRDGMGWDGEIGFNRWTSPFYMGCYDRSRVGTSLETVQEETMAIGETLREFSKETE